MKQTSIYFVVRTHGKNLRDDPAGYEKYYERITTLSCKLKYNCRKPKIDKFFKQNLTPSDSIITFDTCQYTNVSLLSIIISIIYRQDTFVSADDIIITNIEDTTDGLQVTFFVRGMSGGVITAQAAAEAIQVNILKG